MRQANTTGARHHDRNLSGNRNAPDEDITDLITDLLHLLDTYEGQASVSLVLDMVRNHYEEEAAE